MAFRLLEHTVSWIALSHYDKPRDRRDTFFQRWTHCVSLDKEHKLTGTKTVTTSSTDCLTALHTHTQ